MEKQCFIVMPANDPEGYAKGHINRVYQYIVLPACRMAGFTPIRIGDPSIDDTPLGIIKTIIDSDLVLCDVTVNNPSSLYVLAMRQTAGLPVMLIKDLKTSMKANLPEFEILEYDESLRIDTVENEIQQLGEALRKAYDEKGMPNALLSRLNIGVTEEPAPVPMPAPPYAETESTTAPLEADEEEKIQPLPVISPLPAYVSDPLTEEDISRLKVGDSFFHLNYGKGEILTINHKTKDILAKVKFDSGSKLLVLVPLDVFRKIK